MPTRPRVRLVVGSGRPPLALALTPRRPWSIRAGGVLRVRFVVTRPARVSVALLADPSVALPARHAATRAGAGRGAIALRAARPGEYTLRVSAQGAGGEVVERRFLRVVG